MQSRHRNPNDGMYNSNPNYRNFNRRGGGGGGGFGRKPYLPPPPPRREEIYNDVGRCAAEYLAYLGFISPSTIPPKWPNSGKERDSPIPEGRTSALNRLGNSEYPKRRYNDEYNYMGAKNSTRGGRRRMGPYSRGYNSDWGRENDRWMGRSRGYPDTMEEEDDYAPGYHRARRSGFDERPSRSEFTGESGSENHDVADDTGSKASSSSTRKEPRGGGDVDLSKVVGEGNKVPNSDGGDEVKSDESEDSKKKNVEVKVGESESNSGGDLLKFCGFAKVPTKPRSALGQKSTSIEQGLANDGNNAVEVASEAPKISRGEGTMEDSLSDQAKTLKCQIPDSSDIPSVQLMEESVDPQQESSQCPPGFISSVQMVDAKEESGEKEGKKRQREPSSENEYPLLYKLRTRRSSPDDESTPEDKEMAEVVSIDQEKRVDNAIFPKGEPEVNVKLEDERQLQPTSFKICDLNLIGTPEITEIPDDPAIHNFQTSAPTLDTGKEPSMDFGLSIGKISNVTDEFSQLADDDKVIQVIDLEDDTPVEANASDALKPKDEPLYSTLDNILSNTEHADLPGMPDNYSLALSEFLGTDISGCPSVHSDLNNLQTGMGLHDAQGVPNDDDSIYVSLGEIPIGFMEVWDQPPQEYEKYF